MKLCKREREFLQLFYLALVIVWCVSKRREGKFSSLCGKFLFVVVEFFFHGCEWTRQWREWAKISQNWAVNGDIFTIIQCAGTSHCTIYHNQRGKWTSFSLKSILKLVAFEIFFSPFFSCTEQPTSALMENCSRRKFTSDWMGEKFEAPVWCCSLKASWHWKMHALRRRQCECGKQPREDGDEWWRSCEIWIIVQSQIAEGFGVSRVSHLHCSIHHSFN